MTDIFRRDVAGMQGYDVLFQWEPGHIGGGFMIAVAAFQSHRVVHVTCLMNRQLRLRHAAPVGYGDCILHPWKFIDMDIWMKKVLI